MELIDLLNQFEIREEPVEAEPFGGGHINDTFRIRVSDSRHPGYLLQRINYKVFKDVSALMANIHTVTNYLRKHSEDYHYEVLRLIPAKDGNAFVEMDSGYWRLFHFVNGARSYDRAEDPLHAYEAAKAFGAFACQLKDLPAASLSMTIPDFHSMSERLQQFWESLALMEMDRSRAEHPQITIVNEHAEAMDDLYGFMKKELPLRVMHNDTKFNNVLFDHKGKAVAVIDLDTVMPGYVLFDIGDGIRSGVITADEDEQDLALVQVDEELYAAYLKGYLGASSGMLTESEKALIPQAGSYMAFIMGVRFLTDYLMGDVYYKTEYPDQNLYRARCQLEVFRKLKEWEGWATELVESC